jgi:hypothetical protein
MPFMLSRNVNFVGFYFSAQFNRLFLPLFLLTSGLPSSERLQGLNPVLAQFAHFERFKPIKYKQVSKSAKVDDGLQIWFESNHQIVADMRDKRSVADMPDENENHAF